MTKLLEKLRLVQYFDSELTSSKDEFLKKMAEKIDQETPGFLSDSMDAWTSHKNKFKGVFTNDKIVFKRRQSFFNNVSSIPQATITFQENNSIRTQINGLRGPFLAIAILVLIAVPVNLFFAFRLFNRPEIMEPSAVVGLCFSSIFFLIIPYFFIRIGISGLRKRISKELYKIERD